MKEVSSVNRNDQYKDLFANIEISDSVKNELYENCRKGKRAGDIKFRYATGLTALIGVLIFGGSGITAAACYQSVQSRMEAMPKAEIQEYVLDLENDTGITIDETFSRKLTDSENIRVAELERKYNAEGHFPESDVKRVATLAQWDGNSVCYVEEYHKLYLPDEMSDEQILTFIDYLTKKEYVMDGAKQDGDVVSPPYAGVSAASKDDLIALAKKDLKHLFKDADLDGWDTSVAAFKPSAENPEYGTSHDTYTVYFNPVGGSSYSNRYVVAYNMDDMSLGTVAFDGREHVSSLKSFSEAEAAERLNSDRATVLSKVQELYGLDNPDSVRSEVYFDLTDSGENDVRQNRYVIAYGSTEVDLIWDIGAKEISSIEFVKR